MLGGKPQWGSIKGKVEKTGGWGRDQSRRKKQRPNIWKLGSHGEVLHVGAHTGDKRKWG